MTTHFSQNAGYLLTTESSSATPTITGSALRNDYIATALTVNANLAVPSGTINYNGTFRFRITAFGGTRTISRNAIFLAGNQTRPTSIASGETLIEIYQGVGNSLVCVSSEVTSVPAPNLGITVANSSAYDAGGFTDNHTLAAFNCSGSNSFLVLGVAQRNFDTEVAGATANAGAMTLRSGATSVNANACGVGVFEQVINNTSFNIVVNTPAFRLAALMAVALNGVDTANPTVGTPVVAGNFNTTATASYTGTAGNMLIVFINTQGAATLTASNCTQLINADHPDGNLGQYFVGHVEATGSAQTIGATLGAADNWRLSIVEVRQA